MLTVQGDAAVPSEAKGAVLALGNFDGVHRGHQALIAKVLEIARATGRPAGVLVFDPHPHAFFKPERPHFELTPIARKLALFEEAGLDVAVVLPFNAALASLEAERFISDILVGALAVSHLVVGYHFCFGHNRTGSVETLRAAGAARGFGVTVVSPVAEGDEPYSSTGVRRRLAEGDVRAAAAMLGRPWSVTGRVVGGAKRGVGLGFPTANVALPKGTALGHGIFAVRVRLEGKAETLNGAAYFGTRPTFDDGQPVLEVFLFDFDADIYGREIEVAFIDKVRGDQKFDTADALAAQMRADCEKARALLAAGA